ncbi:MAG: DUF308 domain-containing protein [Acidimicrobiia bacterium]|nr:DUF308 domain-containing protein [Acidimicrobiia bacterium]
MIRAPRIDLSALLEPATLRALAAVIASAVLIVVERTPTVYAVVVGVALLVAGLAGLSQRRQGANLARFRLSVSAVLVLAGVVLIAWPGHTMTTVGRIIGTALVGAGLLRLLGEMLGLWADRDRLLDRVTGVFLVGAGVAVILIPEVLGRVALTIGAAAWLLGGLATVVATCGPRPRPRR